MFKKGFEKVSFVGGALLGAGLGGEVDKKTGDIKNRSIGAIRGALTDLGVGIGARTGAMLGRNIPSKTFIRGIPAGQVASAVLGALVGGTGGYQAAKHFGHKYDYETKRGKK